MDGSVLEVNNATVEHDHLAKKMKADCDKIDYVPITREPFHFLESRKLYFPNRDQSNVYKPGFFCLDAQPNFDVDASVDPNIVHVDSLVHVALVCKPNAVARDREIIKKATRSFQQFDLESCAEHDVTCVLKCCPRGESMMLTGPAGLTCVTTPTQLGNWTPEFYDEAFNKVCMKKKKRKNVTPWS
jgi:hypothetical protein